MEHTGSAMESPLFSVPYEGRLALRAQLGAARAGQARATNLGLQTKGPNVASRTVGHGHVYGHARAIPT
jgi:hypothetical protein